MTLTVGGNYGMCHMLSHCGQVMVVRISQQLCKSACQVNYTGFSSCTYCFSNFFCIQVKRVNEECVNLAH